MSTIKFDPNIDWNTLDSNSNSNHDVLEIAFDDEENEKKFDKLVEEKKIKSPFKRTSSGNLELHTDNASFVEFKATYSENYDKNDNKKLKSIKSDRSNPSSSQESSRRDRRNYDDDYDSDELIENNPEILERRQKQIDYGKNTQGYENYLKAIPKNNRSREHPQTPQKYLKHSRRSWDALIKMWRKKLHEYDNYGK